MPAPGGARLPQRQAAAMPSTAAITTPADRRHHSDPAITTDVVMAGSAAWYATPITTDPGLGTIITVVERVTRIELALSAWEQSGYA
jgi:hypothetical protein